MKMAKDGCIFVAYYHTYLIATSTDSTTYHAYSWCEYSRCIIESLMKDCTNICDDCDDTLLFGMEI